MYIDLQSVRLFYKHVGSGEPLLFLHGNSEDHTIFDPLVEKLKDHYAIYAIDSRDHGRSGKTGQINYNLMADDIYGFITKLNLGQVNVAGFSDGAITTLILSMEHPEVLKKMILMGPNTNPDDLTPEAVAFLKDIIEDHESPLFKMIFTEPQLKVEDLAKINVPSLLLFGQNDLFKQEMITMLANTLKNTTLKILPGHDHISYIVENDLMYPDFVSFLG
ncbi:MAG: alpha/beta hydrolase, partial [Deltaproteobacteria bacterium]|nr:alpha/beta hydrolase [Deltaproteobacteria bacterium]